MEGVCIPSGVQVSISMELGGLGSRLTDLSDRIRVTMFTILKYGRSSPKCSPSLRMSVLKLSPNYLRFGSSECFPPTPVSNLLTWGIISSAFSLLSCEVEEIVKYNVFSQWRSQIGV